MYLHLNKCRIAKDLVDVGIELEKRIEREFVQGSDEWVRAVELLGRIYERLEALFYRPSL